MARKEEKKKKKMLTFKEFDPSKYIDLKPAIEQSEGSEIADSLDEAPLSMVQRRRRGRVMKKYKNKIAMARKKAKRRKASPEKLKQRARRQARDVMRRRLMKNKKYSEMSPMEKINLDKRLAKVPAAAIERIAKRLLPSVRKAETERLSKARSSKNEDFTPDELFEMFITENRKAGEDSDIGHLPGSQPKGYYKGVEKSKKDDRLAHFKKYGKMDDDNPAAYKPAPGDKEAETKPSKYTKKYKELYGEASESDAVPRKRYHMGLEKNGSVKTDKRFRYFKKKLEETFDLNEILQLQEEVENLFESNPKKAIKKKAKETGISYSILKDVFDRGVAAWRTGHRPGTTPVQWGLARINSFATGGKTRTTADKDLWAKHKKNEEVSLDGKTDPSNREWGTNSLTKIYKKDTPGQNLKEQSPLMKPFDRGSRVKFTYVKLTDDPEYVEGSVVGTDPATGRLRVRDGSGKLYIVKHEDAELL